MSSVITSEFATTKWRGAMMNAVFAMQGFGQFTAAIIALIVTSGFKGSLESATKASTCTGVCQLAVDKMWRVIIGFGAVPACIALYYRLTIPETPRYTFDVARDAEQAALDVEAFKKGNPEGHPDEITHAVNRSEAAPAMDTPKASWGDFIAHYRQWRFGKVLLGTAGSWFFLDVAYYGLGLNNSVILAAIGYSGGSSMYQVFYRTAVGNLILVCAGAIPGYWVSAALIDTVGRKPIQLMGFSILTILFIIIGFAYHQLSGHALLALYVLAQVSYSPLPATSPDLDSSSSTSAPTQRHSSFPESVSLPGTAPPLTVYLPRPVRLGPLWPKSSSDPFARAEPLLAPPAPLLPPGSTMSCRFSRSLCCAVSSRPS